MMGIWRESVVERRELERKSAGVRKREIEQDHKMNMDQIVVLLYPLLDIKHLRLIPAGF